MRENDDGRGKTATVCGGGAAPECFWSNKGTTADALSQVIQVSKYSTYENRVFEIVLSLVEHTGHAPFGPVDVQDKFTAARLT